VAVGWAAAGAAAVDVAAGVAGDPQEESSKEVKTSRLTKEYSVDFLFISLSPNYACLWIRYVSDTMAIMVAFEFKYREA
jgi:hypothetical protein